MNPWPGAVALLVALAVASALRRLIRVPAARGHNPALDGLRGYLAFGVFLHHTVVWFYYLHDGDWGRPPLATYRELGLDCVTFFFMITAFLFTNKVLDGRERPVDWLRLYVARFLRIAPLYLLVVAVIFVLVAHATGWQLREPLPLLLMHMGSWLMFGIGNAPAINAYAQTGLLIAFVTWTLAYEWGFYFFLPLLSWLFGIRAPLVAVVLATAAMLGVAFNISQPFFPTAFAIGALVAIMARRERVAALLQGRPAAVAALLMVVLLLSGRTPHHVSMVLEAGAFCAIACGNTLFGLLSNRASVELGEISYGIYLMHSLVLSTLFLFVLGTDQARALTPASFWMVACGAGAFVVLLSTLTYRWIELPAIRSSAKVTSALRSVAGRLIRRGAPA